MQMEHIKMTQAKARRKTCAREEKKWHYSKPKYKQQQGYKRCRYGADTWARVMILYILRHCNRLLKFGAIQFTCLFMALSAQFDNDALLKVWTEIIDIISSSAVAQFNCVIANCKRQRFCFLMSAFLTVHNLYTHIANRLYQNNFFKHFVSRCKCLTWSIWSDFSERKQT